MNSNNPNGEARAVGNVVAQMLNRTYDGDAFRRLAEHVGAPVSAPASAPLAPGNTPEQRAVDPDLERLAQVILGDYDFQTNFLPQRLREAEMGHGGTAAWERSWRDESEAEARQDAALMNALLAGKPPPGSQRSSS